MSEYHNQFEDEIAHQIELDGWKVFNTNKGFPDLFCYKDGKVRLVECKNATNLNESQIDTILALQDAGVDVKVVKSELKIPNFSDSRKNKLDISNLVSTATISQVAGFIGEYDDKIGNLKIGNDVMTENNIFDIIIENGLEAIRSKVEK